MAADTPAISSVISNYVVLRLLDTANDGFNQLIVETSADYGVPSFQLSQSPMNLIVGRYDLPTLTKAGFPLNLPLAIMSVAKSDTIGRNSLQVTPSTFSGSVIVSIDFYIGTQCTSIPLNGQAIGQAIEDAIVGAFCSDLSYQFVPQGASFNDEVMVEQGRMELGMVNNNPAFIQQIACTVLFRLIV